mmetsp:Transcript_14511/g.16881  ORF Transcript_14511/g.16881 Transcript_14511/m.16881 type:complete len:196 (+) Transcript_14511:2-589(+)
MEQHQQWYQDVEWTFSIVYNYIWSVPVLYFQVQFSDGQMLSRKQVLKVLKEIQTNRDYLHEREDGNCDSDDKSDNNNDDDDESTWDFISQEEHPITGIPTFFFHPCQTSARLYLVLDGSSAQNHNNYTGSSKRNEDMNDKNEISSTRVRGPGIVTQECHSGHILFTWLSMILPTAGFRISPKLYNFLRKEEAEIP